MKGRNWKRMLFLGVVLVFVAAGTLFAEGQQQQATGANWPQRPIHITVGWSAGGTSDTTVRGLAREMGDYLHTTITVTNTSGANGGVAYQQVYQSASDGYTLFGGAQVQATYPVTKQAKVGWEDFYPFPATMGATTIYVNSDSPYKTLPDLINAIKASSGTVKFGSTGRGGNGSIFANALMQVAGVGNKVQEIPYNGGREAGRYLLSGAVQFISTSLGDVSDWAAAGKIRPLANLYAKPYTWKGVVFPPVDKYYPQMDAYIPINPRWGFAVKRDTPAPIVEKLAEAFAYAVKQPRFLKLMQSRAIIVDPLLGLAADKAVDQVGSARGWAAYDDGIVKTSPATFNIPRITNWAWPPNEAAKNVKPWPAGVSKFQAELAQ